MTTKWSRVATGACRVGGVDLATLGWRFLSAEGVRAMPRLASGARAIPGRLGLRRTGRRTATARTIVLRGTLDAGTPDEIEAARDAVLAVAAGGPVEVEVATRPGVAWVGELAADAVTDFGAQLLSDRPAHSLTFECQHPYGLSLAETVVGWASATDPAVLECGTAPSNLTVTFHGPATNPEGQLYNCRGQLVASFFLVGTIADGDWVTVSADTFTVTKSTAGVLSDGAGMIGDGSQFMAVDPLYDADAAAGAWPFFYSTSGSGAVSFRAGWL